MKSYSYHQISRLALMTSLGLVVATQATAHQLPDSHQQDSTLSAAISSLRIMPEDASYQALASLLKRYSCPANSFFQRARSVSRMEFAIALSACSKKLRSLTPAPPSLDLATLQNLEQKFSAELNPLQADTLEARTATLEPQQFSTTAKMTPAVIFALPIESGAVQPGDWEFKSLRSLADRYKCTIRRSYHQNQKVTRFEFATDLHSCLAQIHQRRNTVIQNQDAAMFEKLQQEFSVEILHLLDSDSHPM